MLRRPSILGALVLLLVVGAAPSSANRAQTKAPAKSWLAYGHDAQLTNFVRLPGFTSATAKRLRQVWTKKLDGWIIASPLYVGGGQGGLPRSRGAVFAATEGGSLYALKPNTGTVLWKRTFGTMVPAAQCGSWGISSTPAIDLKRRIIYVISADGWLHALNLATGAEKPGWPVAVTVERNDAEYVWGGLRLVGKTLYVVVASYCDAPTAEGIGVNGRIAAIDVDRAQEVGIFDPVEGDQNLGSMWGWGGVSVDPKGRALFVGIGNSHVFDRACDCYIDDAGYGNAMVKLSLDLRVLGWHRPPTIPNTGDYDFGAAPLLFQPPGCPPLAAANNKNGYMYIWDRDQLAKGTRYQAMLGEGPVFVGQPSYSPGLRMIFEGHVAIFQKKVRIGDGVAAFAVDSKCRLRFRWKKRVGVGQQPPVIVIGDVVFAPGGDSGGFVALAARTGRVLWRFPTHGSTYSPPIAAGGRIFSGDLDGVLHAFALRRG
jgi:outer membrane protein assembly factor BamB